MDHPSCDSCPYWDIFSEGEGFCRRYAPQPTVILEDGGSRLRHPVWSVTFDDDFCGEHPDFPEYLAWRKINSPNV